MKMPPSLIVYSPQNSRSCIVLLLAILFMVLQASQAFVLTPSVTTTSVHSRLSLSTTTDTDTSASSSSSNNIEELPIDYQIPEDAVVVIKPMAMKRLRELRDQLTAKPLILRMGVRSGGCSGMSYVMDFSTSDAIQEDDAVDDYPGEEIQCVVDAKSMLYLYGLELDYSEALIGGGFKFYNPNAEESCGCGSSFGV